jgi:hypothetical protein
MSSSSIAVHPHTNEPNIAWQKIRIKQPQGQSPQVAPLDKPVHEDRLRFVCMSDTHSMTKRFPDGFIPNGDVFLHAGDFSQVGRPGEIVEFNAFLGNWIL